MPYCKSLIALISALLPCGTALAAPNWQELTFAPASGAQSCPVTAICSDWLTFRNANPWPYQTTAIRIDGDEAVIVLSEPPPTVARGDLRDAVTSLFGDRLIEAGYLRWPTGVDGWLEDVVLRVKLTGHGTQPVLSQALERWMAPRDIVEPLNTIQLLQFGTAATWFDRIAPRETKASAREIKATVADLRNWTSGGAGQWAPIGDSGEPASWSGLARGDRTGAFRQQQGKLVALIVPQGAAPSGFMADFRRFAIESDLLLGGIKGKNGAVIIVGRQRQLPMNVLPPLRFETYLAFKAAPSTELAQSYERKRIFAGKIKDGPLAGWDWAPILLSPQLQDGEMGTLLNMADQILKSWSEHGDVDYYSFIYPKPERYPFDDKRASDFFADKFRTQSLRFNWNTEDFATQLQAPEADYLTVERTGALRLLYEPGDSVLELFADVGTTAEQKAMAALLKKLRSDVREDAASKAEDARDLFVGDPVLARVVQNVILFQTVQNFIVAGIGKPPASRSERVAQQLHIEATKWVTELAKDEWQALSPSTRAEVTGYLRRSGTTPLQLAEAIANPEYAQDRLIARGKQLAKRSKLADVAYEERRTVLMKQGSIAFARACTQVHGTIEDSDDGRGCKYNGPKDEKPGTRPEFEKHKSIVAQVKALDDAYNTSAATFKADAAKISQDFNNFGEALKVGELLAKESPSAALDGILERVEKAGAAIEAVGSIRTPSVVLSQSVRKPADADGWDENGPQPIGGHSLNLRPRLARISASASKARLAVKGDTVQLELPASQAGNAEQLLVDLTKSSVPALPRTMETALGETPSDSVLSAIRSLVENASGQEQATVLRMLEECGNCDAVVRQAADGSVAVARKGPPTKLRLVAGKGLVVEELSSPPVPKSTMFSGFDVESVGHFGKTMDIISAAKPPEKGIFGQIGAFFTKTPGEPPTSVMMVKRNGGYETLAVWGDRAMVRQPVDWASVNGEAPTREAWSAAFPEAPLAPDQQAVFLYLGAIHASSPLMGVRARPGFKGLFEGVIEWLARRKAVGPPVGPLDEGIIDLRAKIGPGYEVFLKNNVETIRAASLVGSPKRRKG